MTDQEYIVALRTKNNRVIDKLYSAYQEDFKKHVRKRYHIWDDDNLAEIYQEAIVRLWENVNDGKISESNISSNLGAYIYGIGVNIIRENFHSKESVYPTINAEEKSIISDTRLFQTEWLLMVENPMSQYKKTHNQDECQSEWERLTDAFVAMHEDPKRSSFDWYSDQKEDERKSLIYDVVHNKLTKQCAQLFDEFYWKNKHWEDIANFLGYANAQSARTQKNKCMSKLKAIFR